MPRMRQHDSAAAKQAAYRARKRRTALLPDIPCREIGSCTLYCSDWHTVYPLLPKNAAVISDPPYRIDYNVTTTRRRQSRWTQPVIGTDQPFDPTPWLQFAAVVLMGANHYWDALPRSGSWCYWDKLAGTTPSDFAPGEWIWRSWAAKPETKVHFWRGFMCEGEENISCEGHGLHPMQKPIAVMTWLIKQTKAPMVLDPFMGSGTTPRPPRGTFELRRADTPPPNKEDAC